MGWGPFPSPGDVVDAVSDTVDVVTDVGGDIVSFGADALEFAGETALGMAEDAFNGVRAAAEWVGENADLLTMLINPFAYLTGEVAGYIVSNIDWIKDPIDLMQGDGGAVADLAEQWSTISGNLGQVSRSITAGAKSSSDAWEGDAGETYRKIAKAFGKALATAAGLASTAGDRINNMGSLVAEARGDVVEMVFDCLERCVMIMLGALAASVISLGAAIAGGIAAIINEAVSAFNEVEQRLERLKTDVQSALEGLAQVGEGFSTLEGELATAAENVRNPGSRDRGNVTGRGEEGGKKSEDSGGGGGGGGGDTGGGGSGGGGGGGGQPEPEPEEEPEADDSESAVTELPDGSKVLHPYLVATIPDEQWRQMAQAIPREQWEAMAEDPENIPPQLAKYAPDDLKDAFPSNDPDWEPPVDENGVPKPVGAQIPADLVQYMTPEMNQAVEDFDMEAGEEAWEDQNLTEEQDLRADLDDTEDQQERTEILERLDEIEREEEAAEYAEEQAAEAEREASEGDQAQSEEARSEEAQPEEFAPDYGDELGSPRDTDYERQTFRNQPI